MSTIPVTDSMVARPIWARAVRRQHYGGSIPMLPPSEAEIRDAIRVLREVHVDGHAGWVMAAMQIEAERVLEEAGQ